MHIDGGVPHHPSAEPIIESAHAPAEGVRTSRRRLLRLAGASTVGALAGSAVAGNAVAETGYSFANGSFLASGPVNQVQIASQPNKSAFVFGTVGATVGGNSSSFPSALAGWSFDAAAPYGVYGFTERAEGAAIVGWANVDEGVGVYGIVDNADTTAIFGEATGARGVAIRASAIDGAALIGQSVNKEGLIAKGGAGGIRFQVARTGTPPTRSSVIYQGNVLDIDSNGELWWNYEGGQPGKWRKVSGGSTAGAFHPLTPGRVYDSRRALPEPGVLSANNTRTVSVADRRDPADGTPLQANFVPAGAAAVAANVTVIPASGSGFLAINPGGVTTISASTINWNQVGQVLANGVILTLNANRQVTVVAGTTGSTNFIIDITGYWL